MIERLRAEGGGERGVAIHHGDVVARESLRDQLLEQGRGARRQLRHLDDGAVAGGEGAHQRTGGEQHGVIPRHDDADHAERLRDHLGARRQQPLVRAAPLRSHPALAVPERAVDLLFYEEELREQNFFLGAVAKVRVHRFGECVAVVEQHRAQRLQMCGAVVPCRIRRAQIRLALFAQQRSERGNLWQIVFHVHSLDGGPCAVGRAYFDQAGKARSIIAA